MKAHEKLPLKKPIDLSPAALIARRAKRAAKRAKQREQNVGRAKKMHEARLASPRLDVATTSESPGKPTIHIGCSGWYYWHWKGGFYPTDLPTKQWFDHYMKFFDTVELNAPFYAWPTLATVGTWARQAKTKPFLYTVKVCELITHTKRFRGTAQLVKDFGHIATLLGARMGCFLFQLPPSFHYTPARLKLILAQLDPNRRNAVEFRHASWWDEKVFAAFRDVGAIFCSCSAPKLPDQLVVTTDDIYIRFHGTSRWYRHDYTKAQLEGWAAQIRASGAKRVWAYFNNDFDGYAVKNAQQLIKLLKNESD